MTERSAARVLEVEAPDGAQVSLGAELEIETPTQLAENVETPTLEELLRTLKEARLARQTLLNRKSLPGWAAVSSEVKTQIDEALDGSKAIRGYVKLPEKLPHLRVNRAIELINAGKQAYSTIFERLRDFIQVQLQEEFGDHAKDLRREAEEAVRQVIISGQMDDETEIQRALIHQFGITGASRLREVKSVMTGEEMTRYEKNVQAHVTRLRDRLIQNSIDLEDAAQEARRGVLEAMRNYRPELGRFAPYLFTIINGRLHDLMREASPISRGDQKKLRAISDFEASFESTHGCLPTIEEIEQATGIEREAILDIKEFPEVYTVSDLGEDQLERLEREGYMGFADEDPLVNPEQSLMEKESRRELAARYELFKAALELLGERDRIIIRTYHLEDQPLRKIAKTLGLSESRLSQLQKKALEKLRTKVTTRVSLKAFLGELGISQASFRLNRFGEGLNLKRGRSEARLGLVEMLTIKRRVEEYRAQIERNKEERRKQTMKRHKAKERQDRRRKEVRQKVKDRLTNKTSGIERLNGHRPKEYKPVKPEDLEILLELYGDKLKDKEIRALRLRSGLEDGILWTLEETAVAINLKTTTGARAVEKRGLEKLRRLEPSVFPE